MTTATGQETTRKRSVSVSPFVVEADGKRNNDLLLQNIPNGRVRSRILAARPTKNAKTGKVTISPDQVAGLGSLSEIPGQLIAVNPAKLEVVITDPLYQDEEMCHQIQHHIESRMGMVSGEIDGVPPRKEQLNIDRMKTLVRELVWIVKAENGRVVKGILPEMEDVESLPGEFLLNPGSRIPNSQPTYEKDLESWRQKMSSIGE